ncbi:diacylglycerol/lipid kinase family protein [Porphyromonas circumdentaria]|uniref:diacylglycerol/lipid kinase family protein n=1 Tax=Porphyromonas circumdentaria TaxID=29524 RepID=UPI0026DAF18B|nr:diacylglycerol kinase family protein [Porphyromonas circumdentaria]MDO4722664.1 diacylglycerol kinase family lipid kinase [Porphyromonas circumdentaria]
MKKRVIAIINPISGIASKHKVPALLASAYQDREEELFLTYTKGEGHAAKVIKEAMKYGLDSVIAVGGDGTINEIASTLSGTEVKLGIIPRGSGNGLARALGIPMQNDAEAVRIITEGKVAPIDMGLANGSPFFCTFGVGFDAQITKRYDDAATRGFLTYIKSAIDEYISFKPQEYKISIDGHDIGGKAFLITCANIEQYGNNAYIAPNASPSDGLLDLVIIRPLEGIHAAQVALQLFTKTIDKNARIESYRGSNIVIERKEAGAAQIDGESVQMGKKIEIGIRKQDLLVYAPLEFGDLTL